MRDKSCTLTGISAAVRTYEQLVSVIDHIGRYREKNAPVVRVLVDGDLYLGDSRVREQIRNGRSCDSKQAAEGVGGALTMPEPATEGVGEALTMPEPEWILSLPAVLRAPDHEYLEEAFRAVQVSEIFSGVMTGNLEGLGYLLEQDYRGKLYADSNFYLWNSGAVSLWKDTFSGACLPLELKSGEQRELMKTSPLPWEKMIYGRIPMMVTANCAAKTMGNCVKYAPDVKKSDVLWLRDRLGKSFPVLLNCRHCFNIVYNSVPLSLHREIGKWADRAILRLQFTVESGEETAACLDFFLKQLHNAASSGRISEDSGKPPFGEYTTGHEKRGVL